PTVPAPAPEPPDTGTTAQDVAALCRIDRHQRQTRALIACAFFLTGVVITAPVLALLPTATQMTLALCLLALFGAMYLYAAASAWLYARYEVVRPGRWRWQVRRRWYAPGAVVWYRDDDTHPAVPLVVLDWAHDPACHQPWALTWNGTTPGNDGSWGAVWNPLDFLTPTPPPATLTATADDAAGERA
ncbi:hypothetical protein ACSNOI_43235, partial [Actinomadura kijaniata]|uniref:hypothetical protein n=1 Tax=Actinomadura kijaniata TaxID=46161 RepID=UPI003F1C4EB6